MADGSKMVSPATVTVGMVVALAPAGKRAVIYMHANVMPASCGDVDSLLSCTSVCRHNGTATIRDIKGDLHEVLLIEDPSPKDDDTPYLPALSATSIATLGQSAAAPSSARATAGSR
jgi:hypothetical protein